MDDSPTIVSRALPGISVLLQPRHRISRDVIERDALDRSYSFLMAKQTVARVSRLEYVRLKMKMRSAAMHQ